MDRTGKKDVILVIVVLTFNTFYRATLVMVIQDTLVKQQLTYETSTDIFCNHGF